ncbi:MAG: hypothetical protein HY270_08660 [Deltaproteobacteria bacterium]|nr:hypothetical protein [Deltaproteobacteria bacterium]
MTNASRPSNSANRANRPNSSTQLRPELRCGCGSLIARITKAGVELKCRRCKRLIVLDAAAIRGGWVAVPFHQGDECKIG